MQNHRSVNGRARRGRPHPRRVGGPLGRELDRVKRELAGAVDSVALACRSVDGLEGILASRQRAKRAPSSNGRVLPYREAHKAWLRGYLRDLVERFDGDVPLAARRSGTPMATLYRLLHQSGLR